SARHSSPKNGQSTCSTPVGEWRPGREERGAGNRGTAGMGGEATLRTREAASYFRHMGFWRRLFGGSSRDDLKPQRLDYLNNALRDMGVTPPTSPPLSAEAP